MPLVQVMLFAFCFVVILETPANALSEAVTKVYAAEGGEAVLTPSHGSLPITSVEWKHGDDFAAEWYGEETHCLKKFEGRCKLDHSNGALTITGLNKTDYGIYKPEINDIVHNSFEVIVISHVPQPSVSKSCDTEMTTCNLTCEGNTREAEPVTKKWFADDTEGPSDKMYVITKETKEKRIRCMFLNPVGNKSSEIMTNPLLSDNNTVVTGGVIAGVVLLLLIGAIVAFFIYRHIRRTGTFHPVEQTSANYQGPVWVELYDRVPTEEEANHVAVSIQMKSHVPSQEEANHVAEVHVPNTQESTALSNGSAVMIPEVQDASNDPSVSAPLQNGCNGAVKASENSSDDLKSSSPREADQEAESPSVVVEMFDQNPTTPASPASKQETDEQEVAPADEKEADDTGELNEP